MEEMEKARKYFEEEKEKKDVLPTKYTNVVPNEKSINDSDKNSQLIETLMNTDSAIVIAKTKYEEINNQTRIAKKMEKVVNRATEAEIDVANTKVLEQEVNTKIKKQEQKNKIIKLKNERKFLKKEQKHNLTMQKFEQRKQRYYDLLLRYCRKKIKNEKGEWEFLKDNNNNPIINMPNGFVLTILIILDAIVSTLNISSDIISQTNKIVFKSFFYILIICLVFIPPFRTFILSLIGITL